MPDDARWRDRVRRAFDDAARVPDDDVLEELALHARALYDATRAGGGSEADADQAVADQLGRWRSDARALRRRRRPAVLAPPPPAPSSRALAGLWPDVRYAVRLLRHRRRDALLLVATMALGVGLTSALFALTYGVLLKPLPWPNAGRIVVLRETRGGRAPRFGAFTNDTYQAWRASPRTIEDLAAWSNRSAILSGAGDPAHVRAIAATASLFRVLGVHPLAGSFFGDHDAPRAIVLAEHVWRDRFGADPGAIGRTVRLDGDPYIVTGVLADAADYPDRDVDAIVPFVVPPATPGSLSVFSAAALLRPDVRPDQAAAEATARGRSAEDDGLVTTAIFGGAGPLGITAHALRDAMTADVRAPLIMLLVAAALLFAAAAANLTGLQIARAMARRRELAIRAAIGASPARLARQLVVEHLITGLAGAAAGLALAWLLVRAAPALLPADFPRAAGVSIDAAVVAFACGLSLGTSLCIGLLPAMRLQPRVLVRSLANDGAAARAIGRTRTSRTRQLVVAGQVAAAAVLLVGALLFGRSFVLLLRADRGYDTTGVMSALLSMPDALYPRSDLRFAAVDRVLDRLRRAPGISAAAFTSESPLTTGGSTSAFTLLPRGPNGRPLRVQASPRIVSPAYFTALRMRIVAGRGFSDDDTDSSEPVVIVNRAFARQYLGESPLDAKLPVAGYADQVGANVESTVIGVVDDVRYLGVGGSTSQPELYYSYRQMHGALPVQTVTILARTSGASSSAAAAIRSAIRDADARLAPDLVMPLEARLVTTLARPRLYAALLAAFGAVGLAIAGIGLFASLSSVVSQRSREIAIRAALGARPAIILRLLLRQGMTAALAGVAVGLIAAAWLARGVSSALYGVTAGDAATFTIVPLVLMAASALASIVPARRALRLDLVRVLRDE